MISRCFLFKLYNQKCKRTDKKCNLIKTKSAIIFSVSRCYFPIQRWIGKNLLKQHEEGGFVLPEKMLEILRKGDTSVPDIRLTRIDNRLIHGQVATQWCGVVGANLLLVANDAVAKDEFRQSLMNMAAPSYAQTRFFSIEKTINIIHKASANQHIAIICETPQDVLKLVEGGVPIKKVNIGNMHMADGKRQVATSVAVNDDDVAAFRKLQELGVELEIKRVPDTPTESIDKLFK